VPLWIQAVHGDQRGYRLSARDRAEKNRRRPDRPELPAGSRQKNRQVAGDGEFQIHQRLNHFLGQMKDAFPQIEQPKG
jgi:hypothetical protein